MFCPKCKAEYNPGITKCADCDVPLVERLPEEKKEHQEKKEHLVPPEYVELLYTHDPGLVAIIKSILDDAGITYVFQGDIMSHVYPPIVPARLFVRKEESEEARKLLKEFI